MALSAFPPSFASVITLLLVAPASDASCTVYAASADAFGAFAFSADAKTPVTFTPLDGTGVSPQCGCLFHGQCLVARDCTLVGFTPEGQRDAYAFPNAIQAVFAFNKDVVVHHAEGGHHYLSVFNLENQCEEFSMEVLRFCFSLFLIGRNGNPESLSFFFVEWGLLFFMTEGHVVYLLREKDVQTRLEILYERQLYSEALALGRVWELSEKEMKSIHFMYGNALYAAKKVDEAVFESFSVNRVTCRYIETIGCIDASLIIRKYLDASSIHYLIQYLEELHRRGFASSDHTVLLMNSYAKLHDNDKIQAFVYQQSLGPHFDVAAVVDALASSEYTREALYLAAQHRLHAKYIAIQLGQLHAYAEAIAYIKQLPAVEVAAVLAQYGKQLVDNAPAEATAMLKEVCSAQRAEPVPAEKALACFIDAPRELKAFLKSCIAEDTTDPVIWNTYLELVLRNDLSDSLKGAEVSAVKGNEAKAVKGDEVSAVKGDEVSAVKGDEVKAVKGAEVSAVKGDEVKAVKGAEVSAVKDDEVKAVKGAEVSIAKGNEVKAANNSEMTNTSEVMAVLQNPKACYEDDQALILLEANRCEAGLVYLYEKLHMHSILLHHLLHQNRLDEAIALCEKEAEDDSLWRVLLQETLESGSEEAVEKVVDVVKARKGVPLVQLVQMLCDSGRVSSARVNAVVLEALQEEAAVRRGVSVCGFECNVLLM